MDHLTSRDYQGGPSSMLESFIKNMFEVITSTADVKSVIPTMENLKQLNRRQKIRSQGYNVPTPRSAASIVIPF